MYKLRGTKKLIIDDNKHGNKTIYQNKNETFLLNF